MKSIIFVNFRWNCRGCNKTYPSRRQIECRHQDALGAIIRCIICNFDLPRSKKFWWHNTLSSVIQGQKSVTLFSLARKDRAPAVHLCCINPESTPRKTTEHKTRKPFNEAGKTARNTRRHLAFKKSVFIYLLTWHTSLVNLFGLDEEPTFEPPPQEGC